jgi:tRNA (cytidine/uridine-2'-O-)-methyltransferase
MEIILFQPEIPVNTGNIVRTCSVTATHLALVKPLGFSLNDRHLKRAGLDYWPEVPIRLIEDLYGELTSCSYPFYFFSSKATKSYTEIEFTPDSRLIFGSETAGLPAKYFDRWPELFYTIPMQKSARCLNLSNAAAIILYEALRQQNFSFSV